MIHFLAVFSPSGRRKREREREREDFEPREKDGERVGRERKQRERIFVAMVTQTVKMLKCFIFYNAFFGGHFRSFSFSFTSLVLYSH